MDVRGGARRPTDYYGQPTYSRARRTSRYVPMRDGVARAIDYYLPTERHHALDGRLPSVYQSQRYVRAWRLHDGTVDTPVGLAGIDGVTVLPEQPTQRTYLGWFLMNGYAVVVADMRGAGASFGNEIEFASLQACEDEYDVIEWISAQPWSDGSVGMSGISYGAESQIMAAAAAPPSLKAIVPAAPEFDRLHGEAFTMGGIFRPGWQGEWEIGTRDRNLKVSANLDKSICPVDDDADRKLLNEIIARRAEANATSDRLGDAEPWHTPESSKYWDELPWARTFRNSGFNHLSTLFPKLNAARVPTYLISGWFDLYTAGATRYFNNLTVPKRLLLGPWAHGPGNLEDGESGARGRAYLAALQFEGLRWFDHWLRNVPNGVMDDAPIRFAVMNSRDDWDWFAVEEWPPPSRTTLFFLGPGRSGSVSSSNDGYLATSRGVLEAGDNGTDSRQVDYTATLGSLNRFHAGAVEGGIADYGDMTSKLDVKALTYTTDPLAQDLVIAGHPVVQLNASSDADDLDFVVCLEIVRPSGVSEYLTEGMLRASHRVLGRPPYRYAGLPFPVSSRETVDGTPKLLGNIAQLAFEMYPTAARIPAGCRLRLTIANIDAGTTATPVISPAPTVTVHRSSMYPSALELPLFDNRRP